MTYQARGSIKCLLCDSVQIARKLCDRHYRQMRRAKRLHEFPILGPADVFDNRYAKRSNGCWEWTGTTNDYGYGILLMPGEVSVRAHRYSYERAYGPIPLGMVVMHRCDNPPCVHPEHLRLGTKADNNRDTGIKRRHNYGVKHWNGRLTAPQIAAIKRSTATHKVLAAKYGVNQSHISRIKSGKRRA